MISNSKQIKNRSLYYTKIDFKGQQTDEMISAIKLNLKTRAITIKFHYHVKSVVKPDRDQKRNPKSDRKI